MSGHTPSRMPLPVRIGGLSGWLHGDGPRAVLMCGAPGFEGHSAYQSWRILADLIAGRGFSVLRFDYPGEGDSADLPPGADRLAAAGTSIAEAMDWLKAHTDAHDVSLVTLRLGTLLAANALPGLRFARAIHLAPLTSGKACLREMKAAARLYATLPGRAGIHADGGIDLCGYSLTGAEVTALAIRTTELPAGDATFLALPPGQTAPDLPGATHAVFDDYGAMMSMAEGIPPLALWHRIAEWMGPENGQTCASAPTETVYQTPTWRETILRFGPDATLAGVLCEPVATPAKTCVILPNAGSNPHFGWARMSVDHARALAGAGIASLRFDLSGLGDSLWHAASPRACLYGRRHLDDMRHAVDLVVARGCGAPMVAGLCSGGYLALQTMHADPRVTRCVAVNVLKLVWHDTDDLDVIEQASTQASRSYGARAVSASQWKRVLRGEIGLDRIRAVATLLARRGLRRLCEIIGLETALPDDTRLVRAQLRAISQRGGQLTFVHSAMDGSRDEAELHLGTASRYACALSGVDIEVIDGADHELTQKNARDRLQDILIDRAR